MKQVPATTSPLHPARSLPMCMASSVEFGPGMRLVAPLRSRNAWSPIHPRRVTTSSRIIATCAAGPPNPTKPSFVKSRKSSQSSPPPLPSRPLLDIPKTTPCKDLRLSIAKRHLIS